MAGAWDLWGFGESVVVFSCGETGGHCGGRVSSGDPNVLVFGVGGVGPEVGHVCEYVDLGEGA